MDRHVVAAVGEIAPGGSKLVTVKGRPIALFNVAGPDYFRTMQIPIVEGRPFSTRDTSPEPRLAIVNQVPSPSSTVEAGTLLKRVVSQS